MKFEIERTSDWTASKKPCEGAVLAHEETETDYARYHIEIASLEDLVALMKREGEIIIREDGYKEDGLPVIEIYDTYRE